MIGHTAALPPTPPKICRQPRDPRRERTREESSEPAVHGHFAQKSLVLLRLPARQAKVYLLKTPFFLLTLSSLLHPPFAVSTSSRHFPFLTQQYLRFVSTSITFTSLPERSHSVGFCQQRHSRDHTYIHTYIQSEDCCYFASALVVGTHCPVHGQHSSRLPADLYTVSPRGHRGLIKESISKSGFDLRAIDITPHLIVRAGLRALLHLQSEHPVAGYRGLLLRTLVCLWAWLRLRDFTRRCCCCCYSRASRSLFRKVGVLVHAGCLRRSDRCCCCCQTHLINARVLIIGFDT